MFLGFFGGVFGGLILGRVFLGDGVRGVWWGCLGRVGGFGFILSGTIEIECCFSFCGK